MLLLKVSPTPNFRCSLLHRISSRKPNRNPTCRNFLHLPLILLRSLEPNCVNGEEHSTTTHQQTLQEGSEDDLHNLLIPNLSDLPPNSPPSAIESNFTTYFAPDFFKAGARSIRSSPSKWVMCDWFGTKFFFFALVKGIVLKASL
ncbi:hypothetical protein ACHQM5_015302 [Ranunculus cassubicifolius]